MYQDSVTQTTVSDSSWKTCALPVLFSRIYGGEDFDATKDQTGWTSPAYNEAGWKNALVVKPPLGKLLPEADFPLTVADSLPVRHIYMIDESPGGFRDSPEWGSASVILPWMLYKWYGDRETIVMAYEMMTKYIAYLEYWGHQHGGMIYTNVDT